MNVLKGIGAILAGIVFIVVTHTGTDFVLEKLGIFTPPQQGFHTTWLMTLVEQLIFTKEFSAGNLNKFMDSLLSIGA